jgi:hypothetical protein
VTLAELFAATPPTSVAEIQGLYGAFTFPEKLLQKVWLRGDFNRDAAVTADGRRVRIAHAGKWNLLGGPDFRSARIAFDDGREITGDVEVHLHAPDWDAHAHASDPAYDGVVLHVVLFPPDPGHSTRGVGGKTIPVLSLLPLLHHDLEEFAAEDAVENLANRPGARIAEELSRLPAQELNETLQRLAHARWQQKVHFARLRVQRLGWCSACHHLALEVLGYRFNRAPMLRVAGRRPLHEWAAGSVDPIAAYEAEAGSWSLQGVRPANQPRTRLRQYAAWARERPDWPQRLIALGETLPRFSLATDTRTLRRSHHFPAVRERILNEVTGGQLGGTRFDNLLCDGLLPLLASRENSASLLSGVWFHWFAGDLPPFLTGGLRQLGVFDGRSQPACHGIAQGLLGWLLQQDAHR